MKDFLDYGITIPIGRTGDVKVICPQCSHTRKKKGDRCLSVNVEKGTWNCHHCAFSGGLPRDNALPPLPKKYDRPATAPNMGAIAPDMVAWFEKRGISSDTILAAGITIDDGWISFPYYRDGELVNIKRRKLHDKDFRQEKNAEPTLYGMDSVPDDREVLIWVEGEIDLLSLREAGIRNSVSVPCGAPASAVPEHSSKFDFLNNCEGFLKRFKRHILAVDSDDPGNVLAEELARRLGPETCARVHWPEGCKDANDVLVQHGAEDLVYYVSNYKHYPVEGIVYIDDIWEDLKHYYNHGGEKGLVVNKETWPWFAEHYTVAPGQTTLIHGIPGHGKSTLANVIMVALAMQYGWRFAVFSPENAPVRRHAGMILKHRMGMPFVEGNSKRMTWTDIESERKWLNEHFISIYPERAMTVEAVMERAEMCVRRHGIQGLIIDPWNKFFHMIPKGKSETSYITEQLNRIQHFSRTNLVHTFIVAHPAKQYPNQDGLIKCPNSYSVAGSAAWSSVLDNILAVFRPSIYGPNRCDVEINIQKIRFQDEIGTTGMVDMTYHTVEGYYEEGEKPIGQDRTEGREEDGY